LENKDHNQINKSSSIIDKEPIEAANATISKARKYNRSLIEASLDQLTIIGRDGKITDVNYATEQATGLPREKLIGTDFSDYFTEPGKAQAGYQQVLKDGRVVDYELNLKHISGDSIPVLYNASVYKDDEGQIIGVLAVARDMSAIKKYEGELIDIKNNLELIVHQKIAELKIADKELAFQTGEKADRAAELKIADKELAFQTGEKADRAAELKIADKELAFQTGEKADRAAELKIADKELAFQTGEKADRAAELLIANKELAFQNEEKDKRAAELLIANKELAFQNEEKDKRAAELIVANKELAYQNEEKDKRAAELVLANRELIFQTGEKADRAAELKIADKELAFQTGEKADRAAELLIANKELRFQNSEKEKRAIELFKANTELVIQKEKIEDLNEQLENRVRERTAQLESANKELESLSYSISHDLKAPLRHIIGYDALLVKKYINLLPDEGRRYLENISSATKNMGELIDGLLQFSRTGRIEMKQSVLNMNAIVDAYIQPILEADEKHRIVFNIDSMPLAFGDLEMIKSVWGNLIENAVKFTRKNELAKITIAAEQTENETIYCIIDNGAGFDMSQASKLFTVFQRFHSREDYEGTGIGLATVQRVITRHGGRIWAKSKVGEGAAFYFTLMKRKKGG